MVVARGNRSHIRRNLWIVFLIIFVSSLIWSIYHTYHNQAFAYFSSFTRLWEFALGALVALWLPALERRFKYGPDRPHHCSATVVWIRVVAGWLGVIAIVSCGLLVDVEGVFPGYFALWPTVAAVVVIAAGRTDRWFGVDSILASRPLQYLGDISNGM